MPTIAYFYGIAIRMYAADHAPPHFHAIYGGSEASVSIETGRVIEGRLPPTAAKLVREWSEIRREELMWNWNAARAGKPLKKVSGLDAE